MKLMKFIPAFLMLMATSVLTACSDDKDEPEIVDKPTSASISEGIVGKWLLASSDKQEWTVYEFKRTQQMELEWYVNNDIVSGSGTFFTDEAKASLTATINDNRGNYIYLDWVAKKIQAYQIDIDVYGGKDGNTFLNSNALYKIVGSQELEYGTSAEPDYRKFTGTDQCSAFSSMDESIVTVSSSGKIEGVGSGNTYVIFNTPAGHACINVSVSDKVLSFQEYILGSWVLDLKGDTWERDVFGTDGYFYAQWSREKIYPTSNESAQGTYTLDEANKSIFVSATTPYGQKHTVEYRFVKSDKYSFTADIYSGGNKSATYYYQRILSTISIDPRGVDQPNYSGLVGSSKISGYGTHDEKIATVDKTTGQITAVSKGITYIDVITNEGTAVIEVNVSGGAIPYAFEECVGEAPSKLKEMLGAPSYEDEGYIIYNNPHETIDMVGAQIDELSGKVRGITIKYNSKVNTDDVTAILNATFVPYTSQTTDTFKAYMDTAERADATIGVTWDITAKTLTYVNLVTDLFPDYSVLLGLTRPQVIAKMGKEPDMNNDQYQSFFFFDKKGIMIVSAYYTDFTTYFDNVQTVGVSFDDTLTVEQITNYLKSKYHFYPEYSNDENLVFIPEGHKMEIIFSPKDKQLFYFGVKASNAPARIPAHLEAARIQKAKIHSSDR